MDGACARVAAVGQTRAIASRLPKQKPRPGRGTQRMRRILRGRARVTQEPGDRSPLLRRSARRCPRPRRAASLTAERRVRGRAVPFALQRREVARDRRADVVWIQNDRRADPWPLAFASSPTHVPSRVAADRHRLDAPSTIRSRLPASSSERRVCPRGCARFPRERLYPPGSRRLSLALVLSRPPQRFSFRHLLPPSTK